MYPLLYEAQMALRTKPADGALRAYIATEYRGTVPAWLHARVPDAALRFRPRARRRIARWIRRRRSTLPPIPVAAEASA